MLTQRRLNSASGSHRLRRKALRRRQHRLALNRCGVGVLCDHIGRRLHSRRGRRTGRLGAGRGGHRLLHPGERLHVRDALPRQRNGPRAHRAAQLGPAGVCERAAVVYAEGDAVVHCQVVSVDVNPRRPTHAVYLIRLVVEVNTEQPAPITSVPSVINLHKPIHRHWHNCIRHLGPLPLRPPSLRKEGSEAIVQVAQQRAVQNPAI
eukprot:7380996-Prymnesium_polylepis.1